MKLDKDISQSGWDDALITGADIENVAIISRKTYETMHALSNIEDKGLETRPPEEREGEQLELDI